LSDDAESHLVKAIDHLAEWKVPLCAMDIRLLVKDYLDRRGVHDARFRNNCPGDDWLKSFVKRHTLTQRLADNVKPSRAEISSESVNEYFDELQESLKDVPPENIYNYDETNIMDDPGAKTVVCRRGLKRIERKIQHSKSAISIMYCGNVVGTFLPPMVVYKAQNCYSEWSKGGPAGCIYEATKSGWFDSRCFQLWFSNIFLEHVRPQPGTKVIIGDNLASHFTLDVIQSAADNNIRFICLLPNATHLLQPLDIAVFRPLKVEWRKILERWRKESRCKGSIPKNQFPGLLLQLQSKLKPENITAGFKASGIYPTDRDVVLKRIPDQNRDLGGDSVSAVFNDAITGLLREHCGTSATKRKMIRGKKLTPGKVIVPSDLPVPVTPVPTSSSHDVPKSAGGGKRARVVRPVQIPTTPGSSSSSDDDVEESSDYAVSDDDNSDDAGASLAHQGTSDVDDKNKPGQWTIVAYPGKNKNSSLNYIGQVMQVFQRKQVLRMKFVKKQSGTARPLFKLPDNAEVDDVPFSYVVQYLDEPSKKNRGQLTFHDLKHNVMR